MHYFSSSTSPFRTRRSVLSERAGWPVAEPVEASLPQLTAPRYTCAQRLAIGFWSSAKLRAASPAEQLQTLRHYPGLEPVWDRQVQRALDSQCEATMRAEATVLWAKCERLHEQRRRLRQHYPNLFTSIAA